MMSETTTKDQQLLSAMVQAQLNDEPIDQALGVDASAYSGLEQQAYFFYSGGHYEKAQVIAQGMLSLNHKRPYPHLIMGDMLLKEGEAAQAEAHFRQVQELDGGFRIEGTVKLGEALLRQRKHAEAAATLDGVLKEVGEENPFHARATSLRRLVKQS